MLSYSLRQISIVSFFSKNTSWCVTLVRLCLKFRHKQLVNVGPGLSYPLPSVVLLLLKQLGTLKSKYCLDVVACVDIVLYPLFSEPRSWHQDYCNVG